MSDEEFVDNRIFVADLLKALFIDGENLDHLDGYGGALFALDLEEAIEALREKGWKFIKEEA